MFNIFGLIFLAIGIIAIILLKQPRVRDSPSAQSSKYLMKEADENGDKIPHSVNERCPSTEAKIIAKEMIKGKESAHDNNPTNRVNTNNSL